MKKNRYKINYLLFAFCVSIFQDEAQTSEIVKWEKIDRSDDYVHEWAPKKKEKIAVIYAVGNIISGKSDPGPEGSSMMGDETIVKSIKSARENKEIKAILLRIDSGGGSAYASDQMWHEVRKTTDLELATTEKDTSNIKPFIASMSGVAASGGYYIACQADTIVAHPATITGSIGVIGLRFNISKLFTRTGNIQRSSSFGYRDSTSSKTLEFDFLHIRNQIKVNIKKLNL